MRLALYQPDIPQNTGTILRLGACLGVAVDVIGPTGFDMTDRALRRAGLDYLAAVEIARHQSFRTFLEDRRPGRLLLLTTRGGVAHVDFVFRASDTLLLGRESAGVPDEVHALADARLRIPVRRGLRSLSGSGSSRPATRSRFASSCLRTSAPAASATRSTICLDRRTPG